MPNSTYNTQIPTSSDMLKFGAALARSCGDQGAWIYLSGNLGAGKTTFVRGFLAGLNYQERVKSPTYTLVEPYEIDNRIIYHIDLYRMTTEADLCSLGWEDYFTDTSICLIEWPDHFIYTLPLPDLWITFSDTPATQLLAAPTRALSLKSKTARGNWLIKMFLEHS